MRDEGAGGGAASVCFVHGMVVSFDLLVFFHLTKETIRGTEISTNLNKSVYVKVYYENTGVISHHAKCPVFLAIPFDSRWGPSRTHVQGCAAGGVHGSGLFSFKAGVCFMAGFVSCQAQGIVFHDRGLFRAR